MDGPHGIIDEPEMWNRFVMDVLNLGLRGGFCLAYLNCEGIPFGFLLNIFDSNVFVAPQGFVHGSKGSFADDLQLENIICFEGYDLFVFDWVAFIGMEKMSIIILCVLDYRPTKQLPSANPNR